MVFDFGCLGSSGHFSSGVDFVLPLDFHGRVRVVQSMYLPAALHEIEASLLASDSLRKLRSSLLGVVWSRRQPLACVGAVFSLLDGPTGCDPAFCVVWFRFRLLRRYLLLEMVGEGCPGHGPPLVLLRWVLGGILVLWLGLDLVYLCLAIWLAFFSISRLLFSMLGVIRLLLTFAAGRVFEVGPRWMSMAPCSSLILLMFEKEIRLCFVVSRLGVSGMVSLLDGFEARLLHVGSRAPDSDGHLFWECTFPPLF